jgi:predicted AAA+ superfamily ATPase
MYLRYAADPVGTIRRFDTVIIDEIQRAPALTLVIKQSVDSGLRPGRFLVTRSHEPGQITTSFSAPRRADIPK